MMVRSRYLWAVCRLPFLTPSSPLTMVTLEQIRRNVMKAVRLMPRCWYGLGQSALPKRMAPYAARSVPNRMASPTRKIHMPSFPQLSGVRGDSAGSVPGCIVATSLTVRSPLGSRSEAGWSRARGDAVPPAPVGIVQPPSDESRDGDRHDHEEQRAPEEAQVGLDPPRGHPSEPSWPHRRYTSTYSTGQRKTTKNQN